MHAPIEWLLEGDPWTAYRTRVDLLGQAEPDPQAGAARAAMLASPQVQGLLTELREWPGDVVSSHKKASLLLHKLTFAADLGVRAEDAGMQPVVERILEHPSDEGPFAVLMNIPTHFGGSGRDQWAWALCDTPLIVYALGKMGLSTDSRVQAAAEHLAGLVRDNGWPCAASKELGKFRGPGKKDDPCPFANLAMLKALSQLPNWHDSPASRAGAETLLDLWERSAEAHPYLFYMGTDFRRLKAPFVWYDILHVLDALSQIPWLREDKRLADMLGVVSAKSDEDGRFTPESVWTAWKGWDFGQKREPSRWLTLLAWRIFRRTGAA